MILSWNNPMSSKPAPTTALAKGEGESIFSPVGFVGTATFIPHLPPIAQ